MVDPPFLTPQRQREVYESDVDIQHQKVLNSSREDFLAEMLIKRSHRPSELVELMVQARYQTSVNSFEILTPPYPDFRQLISTLAIPSLLVIGGVESIITPQEAEELARLNQCLEISQIEEAGHGIIYDQPERFSEIVKAFLYSINI